MHVYVLFQKIVFKLMGVALPMTLILILMLMLILIRHLILLLIDQLLWHLAVAAHIQLAILWYGRSQWS